MVPSRGQAALITFCTFDKPGDPALRILPYGTSARSPGHPISLSIVLGCTCAQSERIHSLIGDVWPGEWAIILDSIHTRDLDQMAWKWIIRKTIMYDLVNALRADITGAQGQVESDFSLHFLRLSGSMNRVEEYMGQDPRILRGRILARLGIRGMRRFNKIWRPKLRILMLDPVGLACASRACKSCNGLSFRGTFGMFVLVLGVNLVDSWYRSRILGHVVCGEQ
ncbi:hypothetical protein DY000_02060390 [Brassica cretica]|uniref:Uncharacterized protein n=1 Tax=Brassica cretica TaxID=69181 RepID=A0ABQ7B2W8_BRACR|nr:hypothetical protein DY000_02060390 [Brassica cretica]